MVLSPFKNRACSPEAPAPNPNPSRWTLLAVHGCPHAYVLIVRYHDATNFEGQEEKSSRRISKHFLLFTFDSWRIVSIPGEKNA
jgi:hypothetical protein